MVKLGWWLSLLFPLSLSLSPPPLSPSVCFFSLVNITFTHSGHLYTYIWLARYKAPYEVDVGEGSAKANITVMLPPPPCIQMRPIYLPTRVLYMLFGGEICFNFLKPIYFWPNFVANIFTSCCAPYILFLGEICFCFLSRLCRRYLEMGYWELLLEKSNKLVPKTSTVHNSSQYNGRVRNISLKHPLNFMKSLSAKKNNVVMSKIKLGP